MNADYPTAEIAATPEYVLELLRDRCGEWLTAETTVFDLLFALDDCGLIEVRDEVEVWLNDLAQLDLSPDDWRPILLPPQKRTVGGVCRFVAAQMQTRPTIRSWKFIGGECLPAGAFLTARSLLAQLGADADAITPSAPLRDHLLRFGPGWVIDLARMAPGQLPPVETRYALELWSHACWLIVTGLVLLASAIGDNAGVVCCCGCCFLLVAQLMIGVVSGMLPARIRVGNLVTFRDLAYALAGQESRRRIQPTP